MALHTGVCLLLLSVGTAVLSRDTPLMLVFRDPGPAGTLARRVLPLAVLIPIAAGAARLWGEHLGYYGPKAGVALLVVANVLVTSALLVPAIFALYRSDCIRKAGEMALKQSEHFSRTINEASPDCVSLLDLNGNVLFSNDAAVRAYSLTSAAELVGRPWGYRLDQRTRVDAAAALAAARAGGVGRLTLSLPDERCGLRWFESLVSKLSDADGRPVRYLVMSRDITQQKTVEDQMRWTATHDALTELPNRALFQSQLQRMASEGGNNRFALLLLDVDDFKQVNDTLGHDAGDALLCTVADRLRRSLRAEDFVARLGGDEFAIILHGVGSSAAACSAAENIVEALREPWLYNGRLSECRVSIGASIRLDASDDLSELLKNADMALYAAKVQERGRIAVFHPVMRAAMQKRTSELALARHALRENLILPVYQPKVELGSGKLVGFEALLRWRHPARGLQLPDTLTTAFEDYELARELTDRILTGVLRDMRCWLDAGLEFGHVAINAAAADFKQKDFAERLLARLDAAAVPRDRFQVEVTETVFLGRGAEYVERALKTLSESGIRIALDDFGTGYASLSHLKQFPVDVVKIDRSFLRDIREDAHNAAIIKTVVSLGRSLQIDVVAEGVETPQQQAFLIAQGCRLGQGFLYGKASPAEHIPDLLRSWFEKLRSAA
jgi:diguanylate cyclase (GGDEF)-like protein/PAS domain S-box-containing protein